MGGGVQLIRGLHRPVVTPFLRFLKRNLKGRSGHADRLMQYHNALTNKWVVGYWTNKERGMIVEILTMDKPHSQTYDDTLQVMFNMDQTRRMRAIDAAFKKMKADTYNQMKTWQEVEAKRKDIREHVRRNMSEVHRNDPRLLEAI